MLAGATDIDPVRPRGNHIGQRRIRIKLGAELVEIGDIHFRALTHDAGIRLDFVKDQAQQRRLAGAVGADQADLVAALNAGREIAHNLPLTVGFENMLKFGHQLAALVAGIDLQIDLAHPLAPRLTFGAQLIEPLDAEHGARAARFDALANPDFLFLEQLVGACIGQPFLMQQGFLAQLVFLETAGEADQFSTIQLNDARTDAIKEGTVVGDEEQGNAGFDQQVFQPFDGGNIQMIGRLVEQQHLGRHGQRLSQCQTLFLAAGQAADLGIRIETEALNHPLCLRLVGPGAARFEFVLQFGHALQQHLVIGVDFAQLVRHLVVFSEQGGVFAHAGNHCLENRGLRIERRLLRHVADTDTGLHPDFAIVKASAPAPRRHRGEQGRFAGTVAADQRHPLARIEQKIGMVEERHVAVGKAGV